MVKKVILKRYFTNEISEDLLNQMEDFIHSIIPTLPENHLKKNHLNQSNVEFYIATIDDNVTGVFSFSSHWVVPPKETKPIFLMSSWLFYRENIKEMKHVSQKASFVFLSNHLGKTWFLKRFYLVGGTCNPRLYVQFVKHFPKVLPRFNSPLNDEEINFFNLCLSKTTNKTVNKYSVKQYTSFTQETDITDDYKKIFYTKNEKINDYFFDHNILKKKNEKIFIANKHLLALLGYYSPILALKMHLKRFFQKK